MLHENKNYSNNYYNISEKYFGVCDITVYIQNAGMAEKKLKVALRSERSESATEGVKIGSGEKFKINWMWAIMLFLNYQPTA